MKVSNSWTSMKEERSGKSWIRFAIICHRTKCSSDTLMIFLFHPNVHVPDWNARYTKARCFTRLFRCDCILFSIFTTINDAMIAFECIKCTKQATNVEYRRTFNKNQLKFQTRVGYKKSQSRRREKYKIMENKMPCKINAYTVRRAVVVLVDKRPNEYRTTRLPFT